MKLIINIVIPVLGLFLCACNGNKAQSNTSTSIGTNVVAEKAVSQDATLGLEESSTTPEEPADRGYIVKIGDMAPDFTLKTADNKTVKLSDLRGKIVMLQFTASWCGVCRREMPFIERDIWQKHQSNPSFALFGIDRDEPADTVLNFIRETGVTYPMLLDPGADAFALYADRKAGITRNVIIDKTGKIVFLTRLYDEKEFAAMCQKINELLTP
ncbi:MAG: TlpA family protein disulfide reductase [Tannerella sp.]|jgi:peroxiredoxin|nr:TlpA family protein disulfide reductase [Tannerella sp.]